MIISALCAESDRETSEAYPRPVFLCPPQDTLQDNLNKLKRLAAERSRNLERTKRLHAYMRESEDFENWINEQMTHACSEEYGQDFEHLQVGGLELTQLLLSTICWCGCWCVLMGVGLDVRRDGGGGGRRCLYKVM